MNYPEANSEKNELGRREIQKKKKKRWGKRSQERKGCEEAKRKASQERTWEQEKRKRAGEIQINKRYVKSEREVTQPCPTLSDPMDCSLPGSSIHGNFQARSSVNFW